MICYECTHPIDKGDHYLEIKVRGKTSPDIGHYIHVACITGTQGRTLKRQERD